VPSFHLRFVGRDVLPRGLSSREVEESFALAQTIFTNSSMSFVGTLASVRRINC